METNASTDNLVKLIFCASLMSRESERRLAGTYNPFITDKDLRFISWLGNNIHLPDRYIVANNESREEVLKNCFYHAKAFVDSSFRQISDSPYTYKDVMDMIQVIMNSGYMVTKGTIPNYRYSEIAIFCDFNLCPLPGFSNVVNNIRLALRSQNFNGDIKMFLFGDKTKNPLLDFTDVFGAQEIVVIQSDIEDLGSGPKITSDKDIIIASMSYVYHYIHNHGEGGVFLAMTTDVDFCFVTELIQRYQFQVFIANNLRSGDRASGKERRKFRRFSSGLLSLDSLIEGEYVKVLE